MGCRSWLGGQWQQLWVMGVNGGNAFPISYGHWDETNVRWSPDGKQLAFISNRSGETQLWLQRIPGGAQRQLQISQRQHFRKTGRLQLRTLDSGEHATPPRVSLSDRTER